FEGPSDTKENRIMDLKLKYQTFRAKSIESLSQTYTRYKTLLNELANDGVNLSKHEINVGFVNSLPDKWLTFSQGLRNANHTQTLDLADIYGSPSSSQNLKTFQPKNKGLVAETFDWDDEEVSNEEKVTQVKVMMALADDELTVGKSHARNGEWVDITIRKLNHALQEQLKKEKNINEKRPTSSKKVSQCISEQISHQKKKVLGGKLFTESSSKVNENLFIPDSIRILYCMIYKKEDHKTLDHEMYTASLKKSDYYKAQPYQYASSSIGEVLAESSQSSESSIGVKCNTCGRTVHSTTDHNDFDHFKKGEKIQATNARKRISDIGYFHVFGCLMFIHNHKDHLGNGYFLRYFYVSKAFRVYNTRRQQIEETYHVTFDESIEAIRFTNTSVDEIGINDSSRYPPDKFLHKDELSGQYQVDYDISYYVIPYGRSHTELTQENHVPEDEQNTIQNPEIPSGSNTEEPSRNNTDIAVPVVESLVPDVPQSHVLNQASTSSYHVLQDRWSREQHIKLVNIIENPRKGMLTRSMAAKLTAALASEFLFADFLFEIEPKKFVYVVKARNILMASILAIGEKPIDFKSSEFPDYVYKLNKALYGLKQAPKACSLVKTPMVPPNNLGLDLAGNLVCKISVQSKRITSNYCEKILRPLTLNFKTFCSSTGLDYNNGKYVAHPTLEAVKTELGKIAINSSYLDKTPVLKNSFPMAWRILFTLVIQVLGGNYSFTKQVNSIQQLLAYCLITGTEVDIGEIIYSDLVTKLLNKSRLKYVSYHRFILCALQVLLVTDIELMAHIIAVNNQRDSMSPPPLSVKPKKGKSQTVTPTLCKSQGPEALGALYKKRQKPKSKKLPTETKLQTFANIQAFLLSEDELDQEIDEDEVLAAREDMDEDIQVAKEVTTPSPKQDQPKPSHVQEYTSDLSSLALNIFDNTLPLTERQLIKYLRKISIVLFTRITEKQ
nr:retrovirus-related Pol polyprotein from transposon TNT 1-94 [Tanacetum cinerariifolium]